MDEGKAAPAAGKDDILSLALEELTGQPAKSEEAKLDDEPSDLSQDETTEESAEQSEETSEDNEETTSESSEDEDEAGEDEAPTQDKVQKRIDKLTAQKKAAAEEAATVKGQYEEAQKRLAELEAQVNEAARPVLQPTAENPLADVDTSEALDAKIKSAQEVRRWALKNSDGATVKRPDGSEVYVDSDQVKDYLLKADDVLTIHAPARQQWLAQRQPAVEAAKNLFPDIFKKGTPMHTAFQATVKQAPELLKLPQAEYWVGLALYGEQTLMAKQAADQAKSKAAGKVSSAKAASKTPTPVKPISAPKTSTKGASKVTRDRMLASGRLDDVADFMSEALFG
jgi:molecular chaperone GrpE (heat shock protein)